jgi:hypothetical protein
MKLSEYIARLQSILEAEGDLLVIQTSQKAPACAQGFTFGRAPEPTVYRVGDYHGMKLAMTGNGRGVTEIGHVVCIGGRDQLAQSEIDSFIVSLGQPAIKYSP